MNASALQTEVSTFGDTILLAADSNMSSRIGPLQSLVLWLEYASLHFNGVSFIGKADDDVWIRVEALPTLLQRSHDLLPSSQSLYIGRMENYVRQPRELEH